MYREEIHSLENSSYITPEGNNLVAGGSLWIVPAVLFLCLGIVSSVMLVVLSRKRKASSECHENRSEK